MSKLIAVVLVVALVGCSLSMPSARSVHREPAQPCATSSAKPAADILLALVGLAVVAAGVGMGDSEGDTDIEGGVGAVIAIPGLIMVMGGVISAVHGTRSIDACVEREGARGGTRTRTSFDTGT